MCPQRARTRYYPSLGAQPSQHRIQKTVTLNWGQEGRMGTEHLSREEDRMQTFRNRRITGVVVTMSFKAVGLVREEWGWVQTV